MDEKTPEESQISPRTSVSAVRGFASGFSYPFRGMRFLAAHPTLVRFWIWPILITALCLLGVGYAAWNLHEEVIALFWDAPMGDDWWNSTLGFLRGMLSVLAGVLLFVVGLVLVVFIASPIAAPFNDALSQAVEMVAAGKKAPPFALKTVLRDLFRTVVFELGYLIILFTTFVFSLVVPVLGPAVHTIFGFVVTACYWALSYIDWPAARRDLGIRQRVALLWSRFSAMLGFGCSVWLILLVPLVNLLFIPSAVTGGTLFFLDLEALNTPPVEKKRDRAE